MTSGSLLAAELHLALFLFLSMGISSADAVEEGAGGGAAGGLFRHEGGAIIIDWSPGIRFCLNTTGEGANLSTAEMGNGSPNDSLGDPMAENGSSDSYGTSALLGHAEWGVYGGALSGSHLGSAPQAGGRGGSLEYGRRVTDLVGVFSIEMTIKLGSNLSSSSGTAELMGCP